ncbi:MAG: hypothetical protein A4E55_01380 [Pelotomaculum sp. PtaU1.Bin035]|nr:MAG: hypothetical protein A4E55_01380 [Pelotomaculum sp. PtaU1.Bin035]
MSILVIGADHLGDIAVNLKSMGCHSLTHLKGRKNIGKRKLKIPEGTDLVLIMTDYVDHNIARSIRDTAKELFVPVVFSKRSWAYLSQKLKMVKGLS